MAGKPLVPPPPPPNLDDYTPSATVIPFNRPIPLLRGPLKASPADNPDAGPYVLAFKDPKSWATAYQACEAQILHQCEGGTRIGCSLAASNKCKPPWWKTLMGTKQDYAERAKCEELEMEACLEAAKGRCREFAESKCLAAFREARVAVKGLDLVANRKEVGKLLSWVCLVNKRNEIVAEMMKSESSWVDFRGRVELTSCKGSDLLGFGKVNDVINDYVKKKKFSRQKR